MNDQSQPQTSGPKLPAGFNDLRHSERLKIHAANLRIVLHRHGSEGAKKYKERYPEAAQLRGRIPRVEVSRSKPEGYNEAVTAMVDMWFNSQHACNQTNVADVTRLNEKLGSTFVPANHFNNPLSAKLRDRLADLFACHGAHFDRSQLTTISKVRAAVKAARLEGDPKTVAFGNVGRRSGHMLFIAGHEYSIQKHGSRDCIRPTINGSKRRIYLDDLLWMADLLKAGVSPGAPSHTLHSKYVDRAHFPNGSEIAALPLRSSGPRADTSEGSPKREGPSDPLDPIDPLEINLASTDT